MPSSDHLQNSKSQLNGETMLRKRYQEVQRLKRQVEAEEALASETTIKLAAQRLSQ